MIDDEHEDGSVFIRTVRVQSASSRHPPLPPGRNRADWARLGQETGEKIVITPKRKHPEPATKPIGVGESAKRQRKLAA